MEKVKLRLYEYLGEDVNSRQATIAEYVICGAIIFNAILIIIESVINFKNNYSLPIAIIRNFMFSFFLVEYSIRLWISDLSLKRRECSIESRIRFIISFDGILSLFALLPVLISSTIIDFRVFRILRLFRLTKLHVLDEYTNVLWSVLKLKSRQLIASFFMVFVFTLVSAIMIYDLEHMAQPKVFDNILSSLWWTISTITTIGYGDTYPITATGKVLGSIISLSGVFVMAIPMGILSAGFFDVSKSLDNTKDKEKCT